MQEFDLSFDLQLYPEQMREAAEFLPEHPQTPVIIDHAGSPYDQTEAGLKEWGNWYQNAFPTRQYTCQDFRLWNV